MDAKVLDHIKKSAAVPSAPQVVVRFIEIMQDPDFDYNDMVKVLSADPGTVSEILRIVNSALFGVRQKIVSLRQALTLLGPKRARSLLLGRYLVDAISTKRVDGLDMSYFWRRSLTTSVVGSRLSDALLPKYRDEVFIGGLLADIGIPILAEVFPDGYAPILANYVPRGQYITEEQEREAVGVTRAEVSAMVLNHWTLPDQLVGAVNLSLSSNPGDDDVASIARIINSAGRIAKLLCEVPDSEEVSTVCQSATAFLGCSVQVLIDLLPPIESDIEELAETLRIDVLPSHVYATIAKTIQDVLTAGAAVA